MSEEPKQSMDPRSWRRGDGKLRRRLMRRIRDGTICGAATVEGRPCLAQRATRNGMCELHSMGGHTNLPQPPDGVGRAVLSGQSSSIKTLMWHVYGQHLPPEQQAQLNVLTDSPTDSLEDVIMQVRLRLMLHVKRYTERRYTLAQFEAYCTQCNNELRQLLEANMRLQLAAVELKKVSSGGFDSGDSFCPGNGKAPWEVPGWVPPQEDD